MNESAYYLALNGQRTGPFSLSQVQEMWKTGQASAQTLYWQEGQTDWQALGQIAGLLGDAPPVSATPPPLRPPVMPSGPGAPYPIGMMPGGAPPTSGLAIASLVLGLMSFLVLITCLPAVICGHMALSQIKNAAGRLGGRGMAITGLVTGYFFIALFVAMLGIGILAGIALPVFSSVQERGHAVKDLAHAKQIALAINLYENDNDGKTPPDFEALYPTYLSDRSILTSSAHPLDEEPAFEYLTPNVDGKKLAPRTLMLRGRYPMKNHQRVHVYADTTGALERDP